MKDKTTAGLLALFLGGLGVHRFYLNQAGLGVIYLLLCWTLIPAIVALIDAIIFLTQSKAAFDAKYNKGPAAFATAPNSNSHTQHSAADELEKLHALKEKGVITQGEFDAKKARLL